MYVKGTVTAICGRTGDRLPHNERPALLPPCVYSAPCVNLRLGLGDPITNDQPSQGWAD